MKACCVLLLSLVLAGNAYSQEAALDGKVLVSTSWLAEHIKDPDVVVVHVASIRRDYLSGHIPGSRFLWPGFVAVANPDLSYQLVPVNQLKELVEGLGISNSSRVVLCGVKGNISPTARMFVTLEYLGLSGRVAILDGGFDAWKAEGREISTETPPSVPGSFTPALKQSAFVEADGVMSRIGKKGVSIVDARAPGFYDGSTPNGMPRSGHVPGARNIYFTTLVDSTNKMLDQSKVRELFGAAGVGAGDSVVAYCHVGQTASMVYFAARYLGLEASLYDGSFEEWSGRMDLPVELPEKKAEGK